MTAPMLAPIARDPNGVVIRSSFLFEARWGILDALSGYVQNVATTDLATLTRASTATCVDVNGTSGTCVNYQERWEQLDLDADGVRERASLLLSTDDLAWAANIAAAAPAAQTWRIQFVERGTRTTANAGLFYLGKDDTSGARLWVAANSAGTNYQLFHNNAFDATVSSVLATATPATNAEAWLIAQLYANGSVQLHLSLDGLTVVSSASVSSTPAAGLNAQWGGGAAKVRVNRVGSAGTQGSTALLVLQALPGVQTLATMVTTR